MKYSFFIVILAGLAGCTTISEENLPQEFKYLKTDVASAQEALTDLDSAAIWSNFEKVKPYYEYLKTEEFDSTLREVYINDLTWINRYEKALQKWGKRTRVYTHQLELSAAQLEDLGHDLQHELIDSTEAQTFIQTEKQVIQGVIMDIQDRYGEIGFYAANLDSMTARLDSIFPDIE